jgi:hypothetical protein
MMSDRELLELAAKAIGIKLDFIISGDGDAYYINERGGHSAFSPLTDDGDALRLAVRLRLQVTPGTYNQHSASAYRAGKAEAIETVKMGSSIEEATRRAIVRAAAEIGKSIA